MRYVFCTVILSIVIMINGCSKSRAEQQTMNSHTYELKEECSDLNVTRVLVFSDDKLIGAYYKNNLQFELIECH